MSLNADSTWTPPGSISAAVGAVLASLPDAVGRYEGDGLWLVFDRRTGLHEIIGSGPSAFLAWSDACRAVETGVVA